ncbi:MAG TPA: NADH:flavin oxidoreductase/NADH oxidase [Allocoleopsis sp.]
MTHLFTPLTQRDVTFRNRIAVSPMCQYSSTDGYADDWHLVHLVSRAVGGAGMVMTEAAAVEPEGRISPQDLGIWTDSHIEFLAKIVAQLQAYGAVAAIQLAHAGRKASTNPSWKRDQILTTENGGWQPVAPSAIPFDEHSPMPIALDRNGIQRIKQAFVQSTQRSIDAGFKVIEIHAAHGYLFHEFLSPLSNQRDDEYGGSFDNRIRLLLEVVTAVREVMPDRYPLWVRISASDWLENGWDLEQSIALSEKLKHLDVDLIDCSSGGILPGAHIPVGAGYQTNFAAQIRQQAGIATGAVGLITSPQQADHIIRSEQADVVLLAREMLRHPYWALEAAKQLGHDIPVPVQYARAW